MQLSQQLLPINSEEMELRLLLVQMEKNDLSLNSRLVNKGDHTRILNHGCFHHLQKEGCS